MKASDVYPDVLNKRVRFKHEGQVIEGVVFGIDARPLRRVEGKWLVVEPDTVEGRGTMYVLAGDAELI